MTDLADRATLIEGGVHAPVTQTVVVDRTPPAPGEQRDRPRPVTSRTLDDWLTLAGAAVGSLCLTWLMYEVVLPFSGRIGFVLCWFAVFVGLYAGATAVTQPWPAVADRIVSAVVQAAAAVVVLAVSWTLVYTFHRGWPALRHSNFYTQDMSSAGPLTPLTHGGIEHAIIGTLWQIGIAVVIALPLGLATAVFMCEVNGRFAKIVRTVVEAMTALPDLIAGLFVYALLIIALGQERNGLAAAVALSITMLPIIARSSEVVLRVVPGGLREASLALGAPLWRTTWSVVLPTAKSGLATALILGMARGIGETAPLLIVTRNSPYFNANPLHNPMTSLPLFAYTNIRAQSPDTVVARGYGAASLLLALVIVLFVIVRLIARGRGAKR